MMEALHKTVPEYFAHYAIMKLISFIFSLQVKLSLFFLYLRSMKVPVCVAMFLLYALQSAVDLVASFWLSAWSNDQLVNGTVDTALRDLRLGVFGALGMLQGNQTLDI